MPKRRSRRPDRRSPWLLIIGGALFVIVPAVALAFTFGDYTYGAEFGTTRMDEIIGSGIRKQSAYAALIGIGILLIVFGLKERSK